MSQRRAGIIFLKIDGEQYPAKGNFTYGLGKVSREAIPGADGKPDGFKVVGNTPFIEGEITDRLELNLDALAEITDATVTLELANSKVIVLRNAWITNPDGLGAGTEEGNISVRFEGMSADEVK